MRAGFGLNEFVTKAPDAIETTFDVTVEIEGQDQPALVTEWINRRDFGAS